MNRIEELFLEALKHAIRNRRMNIEEELTIAVAYFQRTQQYLSKSSKRE